MTSWRKRVEEYVELRRSLGFKLLEAKVALIKFASFLQQRRAAQHYDFAGDGMGTAGQDCAACGMGQAAQFCTRLCSPLERS